MTKQKYKEIINYPCIQCRRLSKYLIDGKICVFCKYGISVNNLLTL